MAPENRAAGIVWCVVVEFNDRRETYLTHGAMIWQQPSVLDRTLDLGGGRQAFVNPEQKEEPAKWAGGDA
jgi:hypothetical protein